MSTSRGFNLGMFWYDAAKAVTTGPDISSFTLAAGEARRVSMTATAPASRTWVRPQIQATTSAAVSDRFILKEAQVEVGTYATTPIPQFNGSGVLLTGYTYSGAAHTTTSARAASAIDVDSLNHINTEEGTVLFRFNPGASVDSFEAIFRAGNPSEDTIQFRRNGTNAWTFGNRNIAGWSEIYWSETINTSVLCHIEWSGFGAVCRMRIDGGTWRTVVSPKIMSNLATQDIFFGRFSNNSIRDAIIFDRVLTDDEYTRVVTPLLADTLEWDDMGPTDYARWLSEAIALAYELETVAESTSFEAMELTYFEPRLGRTQTYAMTAVIRDGVNTIESFPVNPVQLTCDMYGTVVSDISDPVGRRIYLDFMTDSDTKKLDNDTLIDTWDESNLPVVVVGSSEYRTFGGQFRLVANDTFPPVEQRTMLESMKGVRSDETPIIVCIRDDMGDRIIGRLDAVDGKRGDSFGEIVVNLTVIETQHD